MISLEPQLVAGKRMYVIVFSSNAPNPSNFDPATLNQAGIDALAADGNQEIWIYEIPAVADVDLSTGAEVSVDLVAGGAFTRITNTPASRATSAGGSFILPFVADDNREATITDDGNRIAFTSTRNLVGSGNTDGSPEIFVFDRLSATFSQLTKMQDVFVGPRLISAFNANPCLSSNGSVITFISNGNLTLDTTGTAVDVGAGANNDDGSGHGNEEIYLANYNGSTLSNFRQITKTKTNTTQVTVNVYSPGRRFSRDGSMLVFDSLAEDPTANGAINNFYAVFAYTVAANTFTQVATRATTPSFDFGVIHFPTFTDYSASLQPGTIIFTSTLNYKADGTFPTTATDGLNANNSIQIWAVKLPLVAANPVTRLTNNPPSGSFALRALASNSRQRLAFAFSGVELGGGNSDASSEVF